MEAYKQWVRKNREYVHSLESLANGLTWFLPERFSASEIAPEAVTAIVGVITAINEHIIETSGAQMRMGPQEPTFPWSLCISTVKDLETLVEVVAQQYYGDDKKWNFIAVTEASKVLLRLILLQQSGYKMLLHGGMSPNVEDPHNSGSQANNGSGHPRTGNVPNYSVLQTARPGGYHGPGYPQGFYNYNPRNVENRALFALNKFGENAMTTSNQSWLNRPHHLSDTTTKPPAPAVAKPTLASIWSEKGLHGVLFLLGEVLFITRPLVYVLFIRKHGVRSWKPWMLSLAVDFAAMGILSFVTNGGKHHILSSEETNELKRRKLLWALYLLRDPFFSKYSRCRIENTEKYLNPIPLVGFLTAKFVELIIGAQTRYTYTSAS
ncbi:hypothetical protein AMTRI_Chr09g22410 [Amborella trichopoda]